MNRTLLAFILVVLCCGLSAQWSTNAANPNLISDQTSAQVLPKTAITVGGITWIAWMDNSTGNYNTYLQRLDVLGMPQWTSPLLVSGNPTMSWLTEWDIDSDPDCNAVLVFQDIRLGTNNVVAYKISPLGDFLWGQNGIMLSTDTSTDYGNMAPTVLCLADGRSVVAWQRMDTSTSIILQSISAAGNLEWGASGITLAPVVGSYTWPQLLASDDNCVLLKFYEDTGPFWAPTRKLLVQKFCDQGLALWNNPVYVQILGGITAWTQWLSLSSDGMGGMLLCWHDDRNLENFSYTYVQHVLVNGTVTMSDNGAPVSTEQNYHQFYPKLAYEPENQQVYVFWNRVDGNQNNWGLHMQKLSLNGTKLWGDTGMAFVPLGSFPTYPISAVNMASGVAFVYSISPYAGNDLINNIKAHCVTPEGLSVWNGGLGSIATTNSQKLHQDSDSFLDQWGVVVWEDGGGPSHIYAMRFNYNGSLGAMEPTPYNLTAEIINQTDVLLSWQFPNVINGPIGYKVYRNDVFFHLVAGGNNTQDYISNLGPGEWQFFVTAIYDNEDESPSSNIVIVNITGSQDEILPALPLTLSAFPNPFQNGVNLLITGIKDEGRTSIAIYNLKGQLVRHISFNGKQDMNWLWDGKDTSANPVSPGLYLVRVESGSGRATVKLLKY